MESMFLGLVWLVWLDLRCSLISLRLARLGSRASMRVFLAECDDVENGCLVGDCRMLLRGA